MSCVCYTQSTVHDKCLLQDHDDHGKKWFFVFSVNQWY